MVEATGAMAGATPRPANNDPSKTAGSRTVLNAPFQITPMQDRNRYMKLLVYGRHGCGKTELAGSAVDVDGMNDVLMIDAESGDLTLADTPRIKNAHKIDHIRVTTFKQVARIQEFLTAHCKYRDAGDIAALKRLESQVTGVPVEEITTPKQYRTVILDSLTEVEVYCTYGIMNVDTAKVIDGDMETAGWPEFRKNNEMVKLLVRAFRDLPMHVIFVCAESYTQDELKRFHYSPALTGKLSAQVQGFVDIVGYLTVGAPVEGADAPRRLFVQPVQGGPKFDAKNRRASFKGSFFDNPSMEQIMTATGASIKR